MEPSKAQGKRSLKYKMEEEPDEEEEDDEDEEEDDDVVSGSDRLGFSSGGDEDTLRKKRPMITAASSASGGSRIGGGRGGSGSGAAGLTARPGCQADSCGADLSEAKHYHRRHKICEHHAKAPVVLVGGVQQRFCQQCSRFHEISEFDDAKRSCRRRLAGHNERRRKSACDLHREGSN